MKIFKKVLIALLAVLPLIYTTVAVLCYLPDTIAAHFGIDGSVDRMGSKYEAYVFPGIILFVGVMYFVIRLVAKRSPSADNERTARNLDIIDTVMVLMLVMFNALDAFILFLMSGTVSLNDAGSLAAVIVSAVVGIVFILLGNLLPKTKRNSVIGMRMAFTMDTDEHWHLANRAGGIALIISGVLTVAAGLIFRNITYVFVMVGALLITLTVATIYSYVKIKGKNNK